MGIFEKIKSFISNDEYKWMELTELCPYCENYFSKEDIKEHMKVCPGKK